ncbi:MAG TPA: asparagine synthase (glutamine-hydrolyzing) [Micavibrio sp.]
MCGFTGIFKPSGALGSQDQAILQVMNKALSHRGPDSFAQWTDAHVGLAHRRLSILDLSADGAQPMHSHDGRYVMIYNGEVYNFAALRDSLQAEGVRFKSRSDTEIILEAIAHWGMDKTLPLLNGMFAIALWDRQSKTLTLARDAMGIKPLFWARVEHGIVFGSEIKALRSYPSFNGQINEAALGDYFNRTYITGARTIYQDCHRLRPGEIIRFTIDGAHHSRFYNPAVAYEYFSSNLTGDALIDAFAAEMERAVRAQMVADVPVAAFLSGGNDSALIALLAAQSGSLQTYSIGYEEAAYDESARAQRIAQHLSLPHEIIKVGYQDVSGIIDQIAGMYDEPFGDASALPTHLISKFVSTRAKVALSGDGADELFAGYPRYMNAVKEWQRFSFIPAALRPLLSQMLPAQPDRIFYPLAALAFPGRKRAIPFIKEILSDHSLLAYFHRVNHIGLKPEYCLHPKMLGITVADINAMPLEHGDLLQSLLQHDQNTRLPEGMLTKVDRASMAASLEVRVPFLDHNIVGLSRALPAAMKASADGQTKKIIKQLLRRHLPADIVDAPKTGFHVPMKIWLKDHFSDWAQDLLSGDDPYLDMRVARQAWQGYAGEGRLHLFYELWCVLMYRQWQISRKEI